jgi:hypothetical protein
MEGGWSLSGDGDRKPRPVPWPARGSAVAITRAGAVIEVQGRRGFRGTAQRSVVVGEARGAGLGVDS